MSEACKSVMYIELIFRQILKTDMETALNGKQWPLSCYGPFKDKPCLPNFIEDMSFEEIREMCYDSKRKNYYAQFHREFNQRVLEATEKLRALPTQQMIDVTINIYDTPVQDTNPVTTIFANPANNNNNTNNTNVFSSNVFNANNNNNAASAATGNIFANSNPSNTQMNPFANTQQQQQQQQQQPTSIFAQAVNSNPVNTFSFANANNNNSNNNNQGNIFAQNENQKSGVGLFAQAAQQTANSGTSIFAQANNQGMNLFQQQQQQNANTASIFRQNVFQQAQPQPQQQMQQQQPLMNKPFAQPMNAVAPQTGGNIFAQANQPQPANNNSFVVNQPQQQHQQSQPMQNTEQAQPMAGSNALYSGVYSRLEDLTKDEIEAFQAPLFVPGKIPFSPPSREFVA